MTLMNLLSGASISVVRVANPGVYRVKPGARVCELVDMAGGMLDTADKSFWNLASELYDGQMLYFPTVEELKSDHIPEGHIYHRHRWLADEGRS